MKGDILENHTLHIIHEDKTSEKLIGVIILVSEFETVFHCKSKKEYCKCKSSNSTNRICNRCKKEKPVYEQSNKEDKK